MPMVISINAFDYFNSEVARVYFSTADFVFLQLLASRLKELQCEGPLYSIPVQPRQLSFSLLGKLLSEAPIYIECNSSLQILNSSMFADFILFFCLDSIPGHVNGLQGDEPHGARADTCFIKWHSQA
jgi:hypothetical protein